MSEPTSDARDIEASPVETGDVEATRVMPAVDKHTEVRNRDVASGTAASSATVATPATALPEAKPERAARTRPVRTRRARLRVSRIDPWSAMKTSLLFAIAGGIMFWVATYLVWAAIGSSGLFDSINQFVAGLINAPGEQDKFQIQRYISTNKVLGAAALLAFVDVVLLTILGTLASFLYNLAASMLGGLEVTLAED